MIPVRKRSVDRRTLNLLTRGPGQPKLSSFARVTSPKVSISINYNLKVFQYAVWHPASCSCNLGSFLRYHRPDFLQVLTNHLSPSYNTHFAKRLHSYTEQASGRISLY